MGEDFSDSLMRQAMEQRRTAIERAERAEATAQKATTANTALISRIREIQAVADREHGFRIALRPYATHVHGCTLYMPADSGQCSCGLRVILDEIDGG